MAKVWRKLPYQHYWVEEAFDVIKSYHVPKIDFDAMREYAKKEFGITQHLDLESHIVGGLCGVAMLVTDDGDIGILSRKPVDVRA